ncbi:hypothetical protein HDU85_005677 [Gaertneriomyces sp. JEL0708]|nr:hypothetical protein HDU85_005677 [Gaertneriomyces sp. JEL0708]
MPTASQPFSFSRIHIALLGDSILDNAPYVENGQEVSSHLRRELQRQFPDIPTKVTLLARDGATLSGIPHQVDELAKLDDVTHVFMSAGGNDALGEMGRLQKRVSNVGEALLDLYELRESLRSDYEQVFQNVMAHTPDGRLGLLNIYNPNSKATGVPEQHPDITSATIDPREKSLIAGLSLFNDVIQAVATKYQRPLIDVRGLFSDAGDYATPIEPSSQGGMKIVRNIVAIVQQDRWECRVWRETVK